METRSLDSAGFKDAIARSPQRCLDHSVTAPVASLSNSLVGSHEIALSRSMTEKKASPSERKLDKLSQREEKMLIQKLVRIQKNGTVEVDLEKSPPVASEFLEFHTVKDLNTSFGEVPTEGSKSIQRLKIAILVVGTRGDVQPFLAVAKRLQDYGHQVRLATHVNFHSFVKSAGVDFYPLGGDPRILAGYMARNKGLIPSGTREIAVQRKQLKAIIESLLPACTEPDIETGVAFRAQAIIANPPAYGHTHVAEALSVPLHIFFTMPWTPTQEFPHPLARVPQSAGYWLSYVAVDFLIWLGIRRYINEFRRKKLKLPPMAYFSLYHGSITHLPTGYMWSPHVVPKPHDWGPLVDIVGYCFLPDGSDYQPSEAFSEWIIRGSRPIYIGFGSMPLEDPVTTTDMIFEAFRDTDQRGIIDRGWGDLGVFSEVPENIFLLEDCPHDWLFPQCSAVIHHGGAGTTATGLRAGCPTTVVPFFGDQFFWGDRVYEKGVGPEPVPIYALTTESLVHAIRFMLNPEVKARAIEISELIKEEDGAGAAADAFHKHLPAELPLPLRSYDDEGPSNPLWWLFLQIGKCCSYICKLCDDKHEE